MFDWLKRKPSPAEPAKSPGNPGHEVRVALALTDGAKNWIERVDLVACLTECLRTGGYSFAIEKSWVRLESGLVLQPGFVSFRQIPQGVQTLTTVEVCQPAQTDAGVFEFQHSTGQDPRQSIAKGFEGWMQLDLPVFIDALRPKPERCTFMDFDFPAQGTKPARKRRVVFGPVSHLVSRAAEGPVDHPFCPCCLFTRSLDAMNQLVQEDRFCGLRLFASCDQDGIIGADCRLNGNDWPLGKTALIAYAKTWPDCGVEFRKQYVILQTQAG